MSVGDFFAEHRKAIDARKAHLTRVGAGPADAPIARDAMPSQADVLVPPPVVEAPLIDATHAPMIPHKPPAEYKTPQLPKLPGVNIQVHEE